MKNKKLFNEVAREKLEKVVVDYGMKMIFISKESGVEYTTLSKWRNGVFDFKEDKLIKIEGFVKRY